jgi:hypothetical protein
MPRTNVSNTRLTFHGGHMTITSLTMEAICTSETSVYFNETTRRYIPEGCRLIMSHNSSRNSVRLMIMSPRITFSHSLPQFHKLLYLLLYRFHLSSSFVAILVVLQSSYLYHFYYSQFILIIKAYVNIM